MVGGRTGRVIWPQTLSHCASDEILAVLFLAEAGQFGKHKFDSDRRLRMGALNQPKHFTNKPFWTGPSHLQQQVSMFRLISQQSSSIARLGERGLHVTSPAFAEPLRKKKAVDPGTTKKQYERKVRRLEKEISKLESIDPKLKPILELQLPPQVKKNLDSRKRPETDKNSHNLLNAYLKVWAIYKSIETKSELKHIANAAKAQEAALNVLKREYPELFNAAIQIDTSLLPYTVFNVKKDTPPTDSYTVPDGREQDITKEWKL